MAKEKKIKDVEVEEVEEKNIRKNRKVKDIEKEVVEDDEKELDEEVKEEKGKKEGYFAGVRKEMKKVRWANGGEVLKNSLAVVIFVLIFIGFFELVYVLAGLLKEWLS